MARILVIDDDPDIRLLVSSELHGAGHQITCAAHGGEGIKALASGRSGFDLALIDLFMPQMDGFDTIRHLQTTSPQTRCIAMCGRPNADTLLRAASQLGAAPILQKPFSSDQLLAAVTAALKR